LRPEEEGALKAAFRSWFVRNIHRKEVSDALEDIFNKTVVPHRTSSEEVHRSYDELAALLGIDNTPVQENMSEVLQPAVTIALDVPSTRTWWRAAAIVIPFLMLAGAGGYFLTQRTADTPTVAQEVVMPKPPVPLPEPVIEEPQWVEVATTSKRKVTLPDQSSMSVKANSKLAYAEDFTHERVILLTDGEARFKVSKQPNKAPFTVKTSGVSVVATGTDFNVKAYETANYVLVSLYEGGLNVTCGSADRLYKMVGGQELFYDKESERVQLREMEKPKVADFISMTNVSVQHMLGWITSNFGVQVKCDDEETALSLEDAWVTMNFESNIGLDDFLFMLSTISGKFAYTIDKDTNDIITVHILSPTER
jgi:hypothetical protein